MPRGFTEGRFCPSIDLVCKVEKSVLENSSVIGFTEGRFCLSIDLVCKVEKSALKNSSVSLRQSSFRVSFHGFMQKRPRNLPIPPKLSEANSFNNEENLDHRLFKL